MKRRSYLGRLLSSIRGAAAVEAAIVLPVLLAFCFAVIESSRALWMQNSIQDAVEAAARCAAVNPANCGTEAQIQNYASSQIKGFQIAASNFSAKQETCGMHVSASVPFAANIVGLSPLTVTLAADSCHPYSP